MFNYIKNRYSGFTLIELLIVVAIIGILAAIAIPNFLQAQTRSKVARVDSDLRTLAMGMELYYTDHNVYPPARVHSPLPPPSTSYEIDWRLITTPISYIPSVPVDVFMDPLPSSSITNFRGYGQSTKYVGTSEAYDKPYDTWMCWSLGPDRITNTGGYRPLQFIILAESFPVGDPFRGLRYNPTNGTISDGDIYRFSPRAERTW